MNNGPKALQSAQQKFADELKKQSRSISTILAYSNDIKQLVTFLADKKITQVATVQTEHVEEFKDFLTNKKYAPKSISRKLNSIKIFFQFLKGQQLIKTNPVETINFPQPEAEPPRVLSRIEYRALRDAARGDARMSAVIEILLQTGMRIGELGRLELDDVTDKEIQIKSYQSHRPRMIPLNRAAKKALDNYLEERPRTRSRAVFVTRSGRPFLVRNMRTAIKRYFRLGGIKRAKVNSLRHAFIVHQLASGVPVTLVQKIAGHKRLATTEKYLKLVKEKGNGEKIKLREL